MEVNFRLIQLNVNYSLLSELSWNYNGSTGIFITVLAQKPNSDVTGLKSSMQEVWMSSALQKHTDEIKTSGASTFSLKNGYPNPALSVLCPMAVSASDAPSVEAWMLKNQMSVMCLWKSKAHHWHYHEDISSSKPGKLIMLSPIVHSAQAQLLTISHLVDVLPFTQKRGGPGAVASLDTERTFDLVSWQILKWALISFEEMTLQSTIWG